MLEIGFGQKIPKLNFVSHLEISQENFRKKFYDQTYRKGILPIKQEIKVFPLFCGMFGHKFFF